MSSALDIFTTVYLNIPSVRAANYTITFVIGTWFLNMIDCFNTLGLSILIVAIMLLIGIDETIVCSVKYIRKLKTLEQLHKEYLEDESSTRRRRSFWTRCWHGSMSGEKLRWIFRCWSQMLMSQSLKRSFKLTFPDSAVKVLTLGTSVTKPTHGILLSLHAATVPTARARAYVSKRTYRSFSFFRNKIQKKEASIK